MYRDNDNRDSGLCRRVRHRRHRRRWNRSRGMHQVREISSTNRRDYYICRKLHLRDQIVTDDVT